MKNHKLSTILKLANDLTKQELIMLNQAIVSFKDSSGVRVQGVITKKNPKTLQVTTTDNYYVNIPATYVDLVINPSKKMQDFRKSVCPTFEEMKEIFEEEVGKGSFH